MVRKSKKITQKTKGQAMAEFALTIPVFLLLVFGIIELSRFFLVYSSVFTAVREATRYGSSVGDEGVLNYLDCSEIAETAARTGHFGGVQKELVQISYESVAPESDESRTIVASCPNNDPGTVPEIPDCEDDCDYFPSLGDRIYIEIATDYESLLGVVPNLTVDASNGRTIMMGVNQQVAVVKTEDPDNESTPVPTEDTTTPEPTEDTTTPEPTEVTTTPEPTEDTSTPEPTEEIVCPTGSIIVNGDPSINNGQQTVTFKLMNNTGEFYKVNYFDAIKWDLTSLELTSLKFKNVELMESVNYSSPTGKIYPDGEDDTSFSGPNDVSFVFTFSDKTKDIVVESFTIRFSEPDENCPIVLNYTKN